MNRSDAMLDPLRATSIRNYHSSESYMQMKILNNQITVPKFLCRTGMTISEITQAEEGLRDKWGGIVRRYIRSLLKKSEKQTSQ